MLEPTGPLPPEVYRRRRALAIGVAVVVLLLLVWITGSMRGGADTPDPTAAAVSSSLSVPSAASTTPSEGDGSGGGGESVPASGSSASAASESGTAAAAAVPPGQCPDQSLAIKSTVEHPTYRVGEEPVFGIVITNISTAPCERDLGAGLQQALVYTLDGTWRLWSNSDCFPNATADVRTLTPGQQAAFTVKWSGTTSAPDCAGERAPVPPGAYSVVAQLGALRSAPEPFNIA